MARGDALVNGATTPTGEHASAGPQFPYVMRNATTTYASSASTDVTAYEDLPGHHLLAVRNLAEEYRQVRLLHTIIAGEASAHSEHARAS
jgi:hypothetical protein